MQRELDAMRASLEHEFAALRAEVDDARRNLPGSAPRDRTLVVARRSNASPVALIAYGNTRAARSNTAGGLQEKISVQNWRRGFG